MILQQSNDIGSEGAKSIAKGLKYTSKLKQLDLTSNDIGSEGFTSIAKVLKYMPGLQAIYMVNIEKCL
jgi:hypothetical protein